MQLATTTETLLTLHELAKFPTLMTMLDKLSSKFNFSKTIKTQMVHAWCS